MNPSVLDSLKLQDLLLFKIIKKLAYTYSVFQAMGKSEKLAVYYTKNVSQSCSMWVSEELSREFSYKLPFL